MESVAITTWAFLAGISVGFVACIFFVAGVASLSDKKRVKNGVFEHDGRVFRLVEVRP